MSKKTKGNRRKKKALALHLSLLTLAGLTAGVAPAATIEAVDGEVYIKENNVITGAGAETVSDGDTIRFYGASGGRVTIEDSELNNVIIYGAYSNSVAVSGSNNTVTVENSTITGDIYGGCAHVHADDNHVTIKNSTVTGNVYGGCSIYNWSTEHNSITLTGLNDLSNANLYGSRSQTWDNTLILDGYGYGGTDGYSVDALSVNNFGIIIFRNGTTRFITNSASSDNLEVQLEAKNLAQDYTADNQWLYTVTVSKNIAELAEKVTTDLDLSGVSYLYGNHAGGGAICKQSDRSIPDWFRQ